MTVLTQAAQTVAEGYVAATPATGVSSAAVLLVALPLLGAAILLLGGWFTGTWMRGGVELDRLHPGYFLPTVAGGLVASAGAAEVAPAIELGQFTGGSVAKGNLDVFNVDEADRDFTSGVGQPVNGGTFASGMASVQNQAYQNWTSYNNQVAMYQNSVIPTLQSTIATATAQINQLTAAGASVTGPVV